MALNKILPDTCAWIDFFNGNQTPLAESLAQSLVQQEVVTCGIVLYELLQGVKKPDEERVMQNALQALPFVEITQDVWCKAGRLAARLRQSGFTLPLSDIVIAALAQEHNCTVLTVDRHFEVISSLNK